MKFVYKDGKLWKDTTRPKRVSSVGFVPRPKMVMKVAADGVACLRRANQPRVSANFPTMIPESSTTSTDGALNLSILNRSELKDHVFAGYTTHLEDAVDSLRQQLSAADSRIFELQIYNLQLKDALEEAASLLREYDGIKKDDSKESSDDEESDETESSLPESLPSENMSLES
jgi:hypothetical protein